MGIMKIPFSVQVINGLTNWQPISPQPDVLDGKTFYFTICDIAGGEYESVDDISDEYYQYNSTSLSDALETANNIYGGDVRRSIVASPRPMQATGAYTGTVTTNAETIYNNISSVFPGIETGIIGINENSVLLFTFTDKNGTQFQCAKQLNSHESILYSASGDAIYDTLAISAFYLGQDIDLAAASGLWYVCDKILPATNKMYVSSTGVGGYGLGEYNTGSKNIGVCISKISIADNQLAYDFLSRFVDIENIDKEKTVDPFSTGGYSSGHVGGGGDFDTSSDPIPVPDLPASDVLTCGMFRLYMPTAEQVKEFSDYLWSENFVLDNVKKLFNDPMQSILGLSVIPADASPTVNDVVSFNGISTGITMPRVGYEYVSISCGTIDVSEFWGAYLDYAPYTSFQLYLPYIGIRPLAVDDVMGGSLSVTYHVNVITGACVCFVSCGDRVLYTYSGSCATEIPVTASNWTSAITGAINIAASIGSMVASGGATAPLAVANMAGTAANQLKPQVEKSGAMSGGAAILGIQYPYLIITRPIQCVPEEQNAYTGYPAFVTVTLGNETGWTVVQSIHLDGVSCTAAEKDEIMNLLTTGVIIV